ncbi:Uncharacterised protein [Bordetella pertussis]|nr:Uncharacterised protein [Bordetella pertussis]
MPIPSTEPKNSGTRSGSTRRNWPSPAGTSPCHCTA